MAIDIRPPPRSAPRASRPDLDPSRAGRQTARGVFAPVETGTRTISRVARFGTDPSERGRVTSTRPTTRPSDVYQPRQWPAAMRRDMQNLLLNAGLLDDEYAEGVWDAPTMNAYADAIDIAASNGMTVQAMLRQLANAEFVDPETGRRRRGARGAFSDELPPLQTQELYRRSFAPAPFEAPDPQTLAALTRQSIAQLLQRQPSPDEIDAVRGNLEAWARESYEAQTAAERFQHETSEDARIREQMATAGTDAYGRPIPTRVQGGPASSGLDPSAPPVVPTVDIGARLEELLRERYRSEIHRRGQSEATRQTGQMLAGASSSAMSAIFGSAGRGQV